MRNLSDLNSRGRLPDGQRRDQPGRPMTTFRKGPMIAVVGLRPGEAGEVKKVRYGGRVQEGTGTQRREQR